MSEVTIIAALTVINFLATLAIWTFAWRMSRDWSELIGKMNADWADFYYKAIEGRAKK